MTLFSCQSLSACPSRARSPVCLPQVRKTTSASTASAMVLNAIERMESHASAKDLPSSNGRRGADALRPGGTRADEGAGDARAATSARVVTSATASAAVAAAVPPSRVSCSPSPVSDFRGGDGAELSRPEISSCESLEGTRQACSGDSASADSTGESTPAVAGQSAAGVAATPCAAATSSIVDRKVGGRGVTTQKRSCPDPSASSDKAAAGAEVRPPVITFGSLEDYAFCGDADGDGHGRAVIEEGQPDRSVPSTALALHQADELAPRAAVVEAPTEKNLPSDESSAAATAVCGGGGSQEAIKGRTCEGGGGSTKTASEIVEAGHGGVPTAEGREGAGEKRHGDNTGSANGKEEPSARADPPKAADRGGGKVAAAAQAAAPTASTPIAAATSAAAAAAPLVAEVPGLRDQREDTRRQVDTCHGTSNGAAAVVGGGVSGANAGLSPRKSNPVLRQTASRLNPRAAPFRFNPAPSCSPSATAPGGSRAPRATPEGSAPRLVSALTPAPAAPAPALAPAARATQLGATAATARERNRSPASAGRFKLDAAQGGAGAVAASKGSGVSLSSPLPVGSLPSTSPLAPHAYCTSGTEESLSAASPCTAKSASGGDDRSSASSGKTRKQKQRQKQRKRKKANSLKMRDQGGGGTSGNSDLKGDTRAVAGSAPASAPASAVVIPRGVGCSNDAPDPTDSSAAQPLMPSLPLPPSNAVASAAALPGRPSPAKVEPLGLDCPALTQRESVQSDSGETGEGGGGDGGVVDLPGTAPKQAVAVAPPVLVPVSILQDFPGASAYRRS